MTLATLSTQPQSIVEANDFSQLALQFKHYPMLSANEEYILAKKVQNDGDKEAAKQLILTHMRYVIKVAKGYLSYGLPAKDLVQEGTIGLMKAVKHFIPEKGFRLVSYASHWIKAEIHEYILKNWRMVKVATTKAQRKLFFNLRKFRKHIGQLSTKDTQTIAQTLEVKPKEVEMMAERLSSFDVAYDTTPYDEDSMNLAPVNTLAYEGDNPEDIVVNANWQVDANLRLHHILAQLDDRERLIISERWLADNKAPLKSLGQTLGISLERVRQIEKSALEKLRKYLVDNEIDPAMITKY